MKKFVWESPFGNSGLGKKGRRDFEKQGYSIEDSFRVMRDLYLPEDTIKILGFKGLKELVRAEYPEISESKLRKADVLCYSDCVRLGFLPAGENYSRTRGLARAVLKAIKEKTNSPNKKKNK